MLINCRCLLNERGEVLEEAHLSIENGKISSVSEGYESQGMDLRDRLAVPGLIDAHTHLGDSFAKDACAGLRVEEAVGRQGLKWKLYEEADRATVIEAMRDSVREMINSGITSCADFREGGHEGLRLLDEASSGSGLRVVALGRDLEGRFEGSDGLGLNLYQSGQVPKDRSTLEGRLVALHAGEVAGEVGDALRLGADLIVHFTLGSRDDVLEAARKGVSVVVCPRSNAAFGVGFPPVRELLDEGVNVALGTDNVMVNSPDMWREMEFLWKFSHLHGGLEPEEVYRIATGNGAKALRLDAGSIAVGMDADLAFIDCKAPNLRHGTNVIASLTGRCGPENVTQVMSSGKFRFDRDARILRCKG